MEKNKIIAIVAVLIVALAAIAAAVVLTSNNGSKDVSVTGVSLNKASLDLDKGSEATLTPTVSPSDATNKNVTWKSSNTSVATVSNGVVKAVSAGSATITVTTDDGGKTATCKVTVSNPNTTVSVTGVELDKSTIAIAKGSSSSLTATVSPSNATNKNVTWKSSDTSVATVSNGTVTGVSEGTAVITVTTVDGAKNATCIVTVNKDYNGIVLGDIGTYVPIYGNANNDLYIDGTDVEMINSIIAGTTKYSSTNMPFADANLDGTIDSKDVEIVRNIISRTPCEVFYQDYYGDATPVNFPLTNRNIAVTYYQQAEACAILGVLDDVKVASKAATVYGTMWPTLSDSDTIEWGTTGSSAITDDAVEKFIANGVSLVVCTPRTENHDLAVRLHNEQNIDFIQLWYNGNYCLSTIQTMGILMDKEDKSRAYMEYCNRIGDELKSKIGDSNKDKSILVISGYDATKDQISILANERHGSYVLINKFLGNCYYEDGTNQFGFVYHNVEWLVANSSKFDYIVFCMSGNSGYADDQSTGTYYTHETYNKAFETAISSFEKTGAYKNGNIVGSEYPNTFGYSAYPLMKVIAAQIYPDDFTLDDALTDLQEWFDNYNVVSLDVNKDGAISYTGTEYKVSYPQMDI